MSDARVIERIRKLMALANDGGATDGEIENAMRFAARLMDEHHLSAGDVSEPDQAPAFGQVGRPSRTSGMLTWEIFLANAVCNLIGTMDWYDSGRVRRFDERGVRNCRLVVFFGPAPDVQEATDLFAEWSVLIATMALTKWGGVCRGQGFVYCLGFTHAIREAVDRIDLERAKVQARPTALAPSTAITLAKRHEVIRSAAKSWLEVEHGCRLKKGPPRPGADPRDHAYQDGVSDGKASDFRRGPRAKQLTHKEAMSS